MANEGVSRSIQVLKWLPQSSAIERMITVCMYVQVHTPFIQQCINLCNSDTIMFIISSRNAAVRPTAVDPVVAPGNHR